MNRPPYEGALVDLDGTVYLGDRLISGAADAIESMREQGIDVLFVTNKAINRRTTYSEKLTSLGVPATVDDIISSGSMTAAYLAANHPTTPILVVGEEPLREELEHRDLRTTERPEEAGIVLASMDREFDYDILTDALHALDDSTRFIATNGDRTCPTEDGEIPDCAAMIGAIEGASGRAVQQVIGKPSQTVIDAAMARLDAPAERCLMVGDRLETDVAMGIDAGMTTVLVRTGVTDSTTLRQSSIEPDYVIDSIADISTVIQSRPSP